MAAGLVAYLLFDAVRSLDVAFLAWDRAGRDLAAGVILAAAAYQLTRAKARCLHRCRTPVRLATGSRRPPAGRAAARLRLRRLLRLADGGAVRPGVMSLTWMVAVAALIGGVPENSRFAADHWHECCPR